MANDDQTLIILDDGRFGRALVFQRPLEIIRCTGPDEVEAALERLDAALASGLHAAGFMAYELGYALEPRINPLMPSGASVPLLWFGLFDGPQVLEDGALTAFLERHTRGGHRISPPLPSWDRAAYEARFARVKDHIAAGDVYQVNLTFPLHFRLTGDALSLYRSLRARQPVGHGGFVHTAEFSLLSLSPELFVQADSGRLTARPMKGTAPRSPDTDDRIAAEALRRDEKNRAENLMIVDLIRNDLSRVTRPGSVRVPHLYTVETYPAFFGMTSTITGDLRQGIPFPEVVRALFPCGSVTGAPKIRAQEIIRELEGVPRGPYTGSIGHIAPGGDFAFNVAIRTAHIGSDGTAAMGIGSGIVSDSECRAEYEECLLKAEFLNREAEPFRLIETMLWRPETGFHLLAEHLERLKASAAHFGFPYDESHVRRELDACAAGLGPGGHRVRLLLDERGATEVTAAPLTLPGPGEVWRYIVSRKCVQSCDPFLRHKTTRRTLYDSEYARLAREGRCDEVLFLNERGELADGSRTTIFVRRGDALFTPPLGCGALDGVLRRSLMRDPETNLRERVLYPDDLQTADAVLLGNSVRGLIPARQEQHGFGYFSAYGRKPGRAEKGI